MYPKILYPNYFYEIKNLQITVKDFYPNITFPIPPEKSEYDNDLMISGVENFLGCSFWGLLLTFFICFIIITIFDIEKQFWASGGRIILIASSLVIGIFATFFYNKKAKKYNQLFEKNTMKNTY